MEGGGRPRQVALRWVANELAFQIGRILRQSDRAVTSTPAGFSPPSSAVSRPRARACYIYRAVAMFRVCTTHIPPIRHHVLYHRRHQGGVHVRDRPNRQGRRPPERHLRPLQEAYERPDHRPWRLCLRYRQLVRRILFCASHLLTPLHSHHPGSKLPMVLILDRPFSKIRYATRALHDAHTSTIFTLFSQIAREKIMRFDHERIPEV